MPSLPVAAVHDPAAIAMALGEQGACRLDGFPDPAATVSLREDLHRLQAAGALHAASIGHGGERHLRADIRGDATLWLDHPACGDAAAKYLSMLGTLRVELGRRLFVGLEETEAHYACYPTAAFYQRHRDRFHDSDARVLSLVSYLNKDWRPEHGGALRLYLPQGTVDVLPHAGSSIIFLSEMEHEVLPATRERVSIAAWLRKRSN